MCYAQNEGSAGNTVLCPARGRPGQSPGPGRAGHGTDRPSCPNPQGKALFLAQIGLRVRIRKGVRAGPLKSQAIYLRKRNTVLLRMVFRVCGIGHEGRSVPKNTPSRAESDTKADPCHPRPAAPVAGSAGTANRTALRPNLQSVKGGLLADCLSVCTNTRICQVKCPCTARNA